MHLSLGGIVKGITTGLETLAETGNPVIAAGAGAITCFSDSGASNAGASAQSPLLAQLAAENPLEQHNVNALSSFAKAHADFASLVDPESIAA
ncbi:MAG TPA: hypothetical protein VJP85_05700 [Candidatus Baltobacteraceae bacterium]|nr:hypothetical protein [Candidatus Baltobacteraceae bacterium]